MDVACRTDDLKSLQECLEAPQEPNLIFQFSPAVNGGCPIHCAAFFGSVQCLPLLLEAGADRDAVSGRGYTALGYAAREGQLEAVRFLVEAGVDKNQNSAFKETPLFLAVAFGQLDVVLFLAGAGAEATQADVNGATPMIVAAQNGHMVQHCCL